jgi:FlaA1/EpsC-like NDP-sugar epimerase
MHEVLWDELDEVLPSVHPRIAIVRPSSKPLKEMNALVRQLEQLAVEGRVGPLLAMVREMIPSYTGNMPDADPTVQHLNAEPDKPLAPEPGGRASR